VALKIVEEASATDVGRQRTTNEDSHFRSSPVFAVADGMGGAQAGEVASQRAVEQFKAERDSSKSPEEQLEWVAQTANAEIHRMANEDESRAGMGTTFTAVMVTGKELAVGHVGDSRLYRLRDDKLERLTHDHSLVEEFVRQGKLTQEEAEVHPQRSIITRALGPEAEVEVETFTYPGQADDVYLLCSDGLTGMISEEAVAEILRNRRSLDDAADQLIAAANEGGGKDNITVVLFRLGEDAAAGEESDTLGDEAATVVGVSTDTVKEAVEDEERKEAARAAPRSASGTAALDAETAEQARPDEARGAGAAPVAPPQRRRPPGEARRRITGAVIALVALIALVGAFWAYNSNYYFIGTYEEQGQQRLGIHKGLPWDLGIFKLYSKEEGSEAIACETALYDRDKKLTEHQRLSLDEARDKLRQRVAAGSPCGPPTPAGQEPPAGQQQPRQRQRPGERDRPNQSGAQGGNQP
jgi:PPM family protein phosphatase